MPRAKWDFATRIKQKIPSLSEQKAIAHILGTLDDKIELNRQTNQTLETMAQAIFKEWFVDFRFPGYEKVKFVDSELGEIPGTRYLIQEGNLRQTCPPPTSNF